MANEKPKWTDKTAIFISVLALIVSCITWLDVRGQLNLFAGQVRAYVQVVDVRLLEPIANASYIKLQLDVKNFGQTAAVNVRGEMNYQEGTPDFEGKGNEATRRDFGPMGPGLERAITLTSNRINRRDWPAPTLRGDHTIYFFGTVWFTDDTTREERKEDWCYELRLKTEADLKERIDLEQCGILTYTSKENH